MKNILKDFLQELNIPYTRSFVNKLFNEHPHRDNMLGIHQMLDVYGVSTTGVRVERKELEALPFPCIVHVPGGFVVVREVTTSKVTYVWNGKTTESGLSDFQQRRTGNALVLDNWREAAEPDYALHQKGQLLEYVEWGLAILALLFLLISGLYLQEVGKSYLLYLFFGSGWLGLCLSLLLLQKQLFQESTIGDRVCSIFHQSDCNQILFSEKSKIGKYCWSEIGVAFFLVFLFFSAFVSSSLPALSFVSWCAMGYGVWSIYYQGVVARQWCVLCVLVQVVLWMNGVTAAACFISEPLHFSWWLLYQVALFGSAFFVCLVMLHQFTEALSVKKQLMQQTYRYKALKSKKEVFEALLEKSESYEVSSADSSVFLGNPEAPLTVTVLTNPHCNPCARMHARLEKVLKEAHGRIAVQYIFSSFNEELKDSCRFLIAAYQQLEAHEVMHLYSQWYESGKYEVSAFLKKWPNVFTRNPDVEMELKHHEAWRERSGFTATPTLLVNGRILPSEYNVEDLIPIVDLIYPM